MGWGWGWGWGCGVTGDTGDPGDIGCCEGQRTGGCHCVRSEVGQSRDNGWALSICNDFCHPPASHRAYEQSAPNPLIKDSVPDPVCTPSRGITSVWMRGEMGMGGLPLPFNCRPKTTPN